VISYQLSVETGALAPIFVCGMQKRQRSRSFAPLTPLRGAPSVLRSATVWIVKGWLMEKRKTMVQFSAFPQPRLRLLTG
jgi:hypothetical protein